MAWVTPKTNWTEDDYFNASDYNRLKDNASLLYGATLTDSPTTDYPDSVIVFNSENTYAFVNPITFDTYAHTSDANSSFMTHTALNKGRLIETYEVEKSNGEIVNLLFDSKDTGTLVVPSVVIPDVVRVTSGFKQTQCYADLFDIADMGAEKLVNDLLYARELNTVLDNLELIGSRVGLEFDDRPYYSADGSMPDADELNLIEEYELLLYNRINGITE